MFCLAVDGLVFLEAAPILGRTDLRVDFGEEFVTLLLRGDFGEETD